MCVVQQVYRPIVITPVPFDTTIDSEIAELTCTIAAQFCEPEATRTLFQRVAVPRRLKTSQVWMGQSTTQKKKIPAQIQIQKCHISLESATLGRQRC